MMSAMQLPSMDFIIATNFLGSELEGIDVDGIWIQQDDATCCAVVETMRLLQRKFPRLWGEVKWPSRSCEITPLDFFLCK